MTDTTLKFEMDEAGYCLTKCPHGVDCMVNSLACCKCVYNFGINSSTGLLRCTGGRR